MSNDEENLQNSLQDSRPRRTIRNTVKVPVEVATARTSSGSFPRNDKGKRKAEAHEDDTSVNVESSKGKKRASAKQKKNDLEFILTNPKSPLVNVDIFDLINAHTWELLSPEMQRRLCKLLPSTAFGIRPTTVDEYHPSQRHSKSSDNAVEMPMQIDESHMVLDPSVFSDPHFESAAKTFQDHLYSGWFTSEHMKLLEAHEEGVRNGTLHAPWKDELWDEDHPDQDQGELEEEGEDVKDPSLSIGRRRTKANTALGDKSDCFSPLVTNAVLKVGDIITYKRRFAHVGVTIEKDALLHAVNPKTHVLTLYSTTGPTRDLPASLLLPSYMTSSVCSPLSNHRTLREACVSTASQLESALLDLDGRIPRESRGRKSRAIAPLWKCLTLWRWPAAGFPPEDMDPEEFLHAVAAGVFVRGGRQSYGTLFYLRGTALAD